MSPRTVAVFCMPLPTHFRRCRALIEAVAQDGMDVVVFSDGAFEPEMRRAGARFVDLFKDRPVEAADGSAYPWSCRSVTFAARFGDEVIQLVRRCDPQLVIADSFALIGRVVAAALRIPYVNVCAGHNVSPENLLPILGSQPRTRMSDACLSAVDTLRERFGIQSASPYTNLVSPSRDLNVCCEPPEFLTEAERELFEPVMFFGSLPSETRRDDWAAGERLFASGVGERIYVSFGNYVWQKYPAEAIAAATAIATVAEDSGTNVLVSLGGASVDPNVVVQLERPYVRVYSFVDQMRVLAEADVFVTHHGLNSTHESIAHRVPMLSYPFEWDQPGMAERCQSLDLAIPLSTEPRSPVDADDVRAAFGRLHAERPRLAAGLEAAHGWEDDVRDRRAAVVRRIAELAEA